MEVAVFCIDCVKMHQFKAKDSEIKLTLAIVFS